MTNRPPHEASRAISRSAVLRTAILSGLLAVAAFICVQRFRMESDLLTFLPMSQNVPQLEVTRSLMRGPLKRALVLNVVPQSPRHAQAARDVAGQLATALENDELLEKVAAGPNPQFEKAVFDLYFPRRFVLADPAPQEGKFWNQENLDRRLKETQTFLGSPAAGVYRPLLPQDPLLLFYARITELSSLRPPGIDLEDGQFVSHDGSAFVFARTKENLSFEQKTRLVTHINQTFTEARGDIPLSLEMSGALPFEVEGELATRSDMTRVSAVSFVAVIVLSWFFFRSLYPLLLIFLPLGSGMLIACASTLMIFGEIHGLTLAFGSALLGVGMDYPLHLLNDHALHQDSPKLAISRVKRGLLVGCGTTITGFLAFGATDSPALLQVSIFTAVGLLTSLLVTIWVLPWLPTKVGPGEIQQRIVKICSRATLYGKRRRTLLTCCLLSLVALFAVTIWHSPWDTSTNALNPASTHLREADARVRGRLGLSEELLVVRGATPDATLTANHELALKLARLKAEGRVESFSSLSALYLPPQVQQENQRQLAAPKAQAELRAALTRAGFADEVFAPAFADMTSPVNILALADLKQSPLGDIVESFWMNLPEHAVALTRVTAPAALLDEVAAADARAFRYNPSEFLGAALESLTRSLRKVLLLGASLMLLIVVLRYRHIRPICAAFAPAAFASLGALAIHGAFFGPLHLFHVLAALLVLSMGIDYGAYLVEAQEESHLPWPSIVGAALSTMASFGTLALSSVPALQALGGIIFTGITLATIMTLVLSTYLENSGDADADSPRVPRGDALKKIIGATLLLCTLTACSSSSPPAASAQATAGESTPGLSNPQLKDALLSPSEIPRLFWQQRLTIRFADQKHRINAVIQNDGHVFQVLAVGPANTRLFLISQQGKEVSLKMFVDRKVDLDPRLLLLDIQRALFWFPGTPAPRPTTISNLVRGFCATDTWNAQGITERKIADLPQSCEAALAQGTQGLVIRYEPQYLPGSTPSKVTLTHVHRDYTILVEHLSSQEVPE